MIVSNTLLIGSGVLFSRKLQEEPSLAFVAGVSSEMETGLRPEVHVGSNDKAGGEDALSFTSLLSFLCFSPLSPELSSPSTQALHSHSCGFWAASVCLPDPAGQTGLSSAGRARAT